MDATRKLFYEDPLLAECDAEVIGLGRKGVVLNQTVAFPEGGGQEGDRGKLTIVEHARAVEFFDTIKGPGKSFFRDDFPSIQVNTHIYHVVGPDIVSEFQVGMAVRVRIDVVRRARLTTSHTGLHVVLMGLEEFKPGLSRHIVGCHIAEDHARLDFKVQERIDGQLLGKVKQYVEELVDSDAEVRTVAHPEEPEALYWECREKRYPCGGTHLASCGHIGVVELKRKNIGKGLDRVIVHFPSSQTYAHVYHS